MDYSIVLSITTFVTIAQGWIGGRLVVYFLTLTSKCQVVATKPLDASEGIRIVAG